MNARRFAWIALSTLLAVRVAAPGWCADWPAYRADAARSGATSEQLEFPLAPVWVYQPAQSPSPAWPEPGREMHRVDFDYAFQPVIAGGQVYFGSSADDTVRALDAATGKVKWRFTTGGPIRFAPHMAGGRCYVASDDGVAYCLDAATGKLVWEFRAAPEARQVVGNGRIISRWPCRSGVLVLDGVAYATAGMWPSGGIYVYALDAATGEQLWCNDTSGCRFIHYPHGGSYAMGGVAPQGYLAASKDALVVPTGRAVPAVFHRRTGRLLYYEASNPNGGSWTSIAGGVFFNPGHRPSGPNLHVQLGEAGLQRGDGMLARDLATGKPLWRLADRHRVLARGDTLYAVGGGKVEAFDFLDFKDGVLGKEKWTAEHPRAYCVALAGNALLVGGAGSITALSAVDGSQIWRREVEGQVRGLAVADGRLLAATNKGTIYCFARRQLQEKQPDPGRRREAPAEDEPNVADAVLELAKRFSITKGFALVIGQTDACMAEAIASRTQLHVVSVLRDKAKVEAERRRLLSTTDLYGSRLVAHHVPDFASLPYARYFANVVVVSGEAAEMSGEDLYRVLRPCGGVMCFVDGSLVLALKLLEQANVPRKEIRPGHNGLMVLRGKLAGAFDWDSEVTSDHRLKAPLESLWFGGPGPDRMAARHLAPLGAKTPIPANGRYFAIGEYHLIAVDAYNGTELWARELGEIFAYPYIHEKEVKNETPVAADDDSVYINFKDFALRPDGRTSEEFNEICLQLDAQSGDLKKIYGELRPSERISLARPHSFDLKLDEKHSGAVSIESTDAGLKLTLTTKDPEVTPRDRWELHFDFRPPAERLAFYGPGAFKANIQPTPAPETPPAWQPGPGPVHPAPVLKGEKSDGGTRVVYELPWDEIRKLTGRMPGEFTFAVTLVLHDGGRPLRTHKFADAGSNIINNGWAAFILEPPESDSAPVAGPDIPLGKLADLPDYARKWGRLPPNPKSSRFQRNLPDYTRKWGHLPPAGAQDKSLLTSVQPLTLMAGERIYRRAHGCGGVTMSATMDFFRSGTLGYYDLAEGSGVRNFAGMRPGCGMTMAPALGLLISSEGAATCTCSYNFHTSLALVPAAERSNEDWAVFYDEPGNVLVQHAALNLGAPGDRADGAIVWLGVPRPMSKMNVVSHHRLDLTVPLNFVVREGFGAYRVNADRSPIAGTDRPWLYASGLRGLHRAILDMEYLTGATVALPAERPPKIDGRRTEPCWDGGKMIAVDGGKAAVLLRHDEDNLYVAYERPAVIDRRGVSKPWHVTKGDDGAVWVGDSFELYLSDTDTNRCLHLGLSASGARYDGLWAAYTDPFPTFDVPRVEAVTIDGKIDDWGDRGFHVRSAASRAGQMCVPEDFNPSFKLGWNDEGLLVLAQVQDDVICEHREPAELWRADSMELFMAPGGKPDGVVQITLGTGADPDYPKVRTGFWTKSGVQATAEVAGGKADGGYIVEALLPWKNIGITPADGTEIGFQIFNNDYDGANERFQTALHPLGNPRWEPRALHRLRLADKPSPAIEFKRGEAVGDDGLFAAVEPYPFPCKVTATPLGLYREDSKYNAEWTSAANADEDAFTAEVAVPWKTLAAAGLKKDKLTIGLNSRGQLLSPPVPRQGYAPLVLSAGAKVPRRAFTVRLHFAELDGARRGERVFDVKLQGKRVLKKFDVVKAAGGANRAVVKEFKNVTAAATMTLELIPRVKELTERTAPIISGIELVVE